LGPAPAMTTSIMRISVSGQGTSARLLPPG
jgi:hypothetical protein